MLSSRMTCVNACKRPEPCVLIRWVCLISNMYSQITALVFTSVCRWSQVQHLVGDKSLLFPASDVQSKGGKVIKYVTQYAVRCIRHCLMLDLHQHCMSWCSCQGASCRSAWPCSYCCLLVDYCNVVVHVTCLLGSGVVVTTALGKNGAACSGGWMDGVVISLTRRSVAGSASCYGCLSKSTCAQPSWWWLTSAG